jgi:hypothetical protein
MKVIQNRSNSVLISIIFLSILGIAYFVTQSPVLSILNSNNFDSNARALNGQFVVAAMPNLVVNSVRWTDIYGSSYGGGPIHKSTASPYDTYTYFRVVVRNKGNKNAVLTTSTKLNIYNGPAVNGVFVASMMPGSSVNIPPGTNHTFFFSSFGNGQNPLKSSTGIYNLTAVIDDISSTVAESNELDNSFPFSVSVI